MLIFRDGGGILGTRIHPPSHTEICSKPWANFPLAHPTLVGKMAWFRANRYRSEPGRATDQELLLRTYSSSRFASLSEILVGYRESTISLSKCLRGRYGFSKSVFEYGLAHHDNLFALRGVAGQILKGLVDIVAVGTGLDYRLLGHRALPVE